MSSDEDEDEHWTLWEIDRDGGALTAAGFALHLPLLRGPDRLNLQTIDDIFGEEAMRMVEEPRGLRLVHDVFVEETMTRHLRDVASTSRAHPTIDIESSRLPVPLDTLTLSEDWGWRAHTTTTPTEHSINILDDPPIGLPNPPERLNLQLQKIWDEVVGEIVDQDRENRGRLLLQTERECQEVCKREAEIAINSTNRLIQDMNDEIDLSRLTHGENTQIWDEVGEIVDQDRENRDRLLLETERECLEVYKTEAEIAEPSTSEHNPGGPVAQDLPRVSEPSTSEHNPVAQDLARVSESSTSEHNPVAQDLPRVSEPSTSEHNPVAQDLARVSESSTSEHNPDLSIIRDNPQIPNPHDTSITIRDNPPIPNPHDASIIIRDDPNCRWYDYGVALCRVYSLVITPVEFAFDLPRPAFFILDAVVGCLLFANLVRSAFIGRGLSGLTVSLRARMLMDLLASIPWDLIYQVIVQTEVVRLMMWIRLYHLWRVSSFISDVKARYLLTDERWRMIGVIAIDLYASHAAGCFLYYLVGVAPEGEKTWLGESYPTETSPWKLYLISTYFAAVTLTTVGYGDIHAVNWLEMIFVRCLLLFNTTYGGFLSSLVSRVLDSLTKKTPAQQTRKDVEDEEEAQ